MNWINTDGDYYVSKIYGSDYNDGSMNSPFKTIVKGLTTISNTVREFNIPKKLVIEGGIVYDDDIVNINRSAVEFIWDGEKGIVDPAATNFIINKSGDIVNNLYIYNNTNLVIKMPDVVGSLITLNNCTIINSIVKSIIWIVESKVLFYFNNCLLINTSLHWRYSSGATPVFVKGYNNTIIDLVCKTTDNYLPVLRICSANSYFNNKPICLTTSDVEDYSHFNIESFTYNAIPSSWVVANSSNHNINIDSVDFDAKFVDTLVNNYNILSGSSLLNIGVSDAYTGLPLNIGCGKLDNTFNGISTAFKELGGAVYENITINNNAITITPGYKRATITSGLIDLGVSKLVTNIDVNKLVSFFGDGKYRQLVDYQKIYNRGTATASDPTHITLESLKSQADDDYYNGMIVKLIQGTGQSFAITGDTNSDTSITNVSNVNNLYKGQSISGSGIPSSTYITNINGSTLTLSNSVSDSNNGTTLTLTEPIRNITNYVGSTNICTIDNAWNTTPDTSTIYEIYEIGKCGCDIGIRWSDSSDLSSTPWSYMQLNSVMFFSDQTNRYGTADPLYDASVKDYIKGRYFQVKLKLTDLSDLS